MQIGKTSRGAAISTVRIWRSADRCPIILGLERSRRSGSADSAAAWCVTASFAFPFYNGIVRFSSMVTFALVWGRCKYHDGDPASPDI
jgi:hypothetical protein